MWVYWPKVFHTILYTALANKYYSSRIQSYNPVCTCFAYNRLEFILIVGICHNTHAKTRLLQLMCLNDVAGLPTVYEYRNSRRYTTIYIYILMEKYVSSSTYRFVLLGNTCSKPSASQLEVRHVGYFCV